MSLSGCSFLWVDSVASDGPAHCTSNRTMPIGDTVIAAGTGGFGAFWWAAAADDFPTEPMAVMFWLAAAGFASSAIYGWITTEDCRDSLVMEQ